MTARYTEQILEFLFPISCDQHVEMISTKPIALSIHNVTDAESHTKRNLVRTHPIVKSHILDSVYKINRHHTCKELHADRIRARPIQLFLANSIVRPAIIQGRNIAF